MNFFQTICAYAFAIWTWVQSWPATFVGVIVGSLFTLAGLVFTNRSNLRNLRTQLEDNRLEKAKERMHALRRDVYMATAEAIAAGTQALAGAANLEVDDKTLLAEFQTKSPQIAKVHVVATEQTALALATLMGALGRATVDLLITRSQLRAVMAEINGADDRVKQLQAGRTQTIELMKQHNIAGTMTDARMEILQSNFKFDGEQMQKELELRANLYSQLAPRHLDLLKRSQDETIRINKLVLPLLVSIRAELDQPINPETYAQIFDVEPVITQEHFQQMSPPPTE